LAYEKSMKEKHTFASYTYKCLSLAIYYIVPVPSNSIKYNISLAFSKNPSISA
jgi:hypothetical protein